jgi:phosphoenolpyruvate carboxylase
MEEANRLDDCIGLYNNSEFFKALLANSMQSMSKTNFALTQYMKDDTVFGEFWSDIFAEYQLSKEMALKVSGQSVLLEDHPGNRSSIALRQRVVLPLLVIQQFALIKIRGLKDKTPNKQEEISQFENMIIRSLIGNINASRNSA